MLDTNVIVKAIREKDHPVREKLLGLCGRGLCISSITYTELLYGVYHSGNPEKNLDALQELLAWIEILPFDCSAAECAGKVMAFLASKGTPLGDRDMLIAGHALSRNVPLITHNIREFKRVPDLLIEDWQA
jgi:tRNA(fMet)-specific endonuclease VapC